MRLSGAFVVALAACGEVTVEPPPGSGACSAGVTQLLTNPGFDEAVPPGGAVGWTEETVPLTYPSGQIPITPQSPDRAAWLGDIARPEQRLSQAVTVPEDTAALTLVVYTCFVTQEVPDQAYDKVTVALLDSDGSQLEQLAEFTNLDANPDDEGCGFEKRTLPADSPHAGEAVVLEFFGLSDGSTLTSFYFDTLSLDANASCPDDES